MNCDVATITVYLFLQFWHGHNVHLSFTEVKCRWATLVLGVVKLGLLSNLEFYLDKAAISAMGLGGAAAMEGILQQNRHPSWLSPRQVVMASMSFIYKILLMLDVGVQLHNGISFYQ